MITLVDFRNSKEIRLCFHKAYLINLAAKRQTVQYSQVLKMLRKGQH